MALVDPSQYWQRLHEERDALRAELEEQWLANHYEHCSDEWPHPEGKRCHWPRPAVLNVR